MDIPYLCHSLKCINHPNEQIIFLKVNNLNNSNQIFYCEICIEKDVSFKPSNFLRIKNIFSLDYSFISIWPPFENNNITQNIIQIISNIEKTQNLQQIIINYFDELKRQINSKIDICQKSMIKLASEIPEQNKKMIQNLKGLSKVENFKNILQNNQLDSQEKEKQLRDLINQANSQKHQYIEQFINIQKEFDQQNRKVNFEISNTSKTQLLSLIENITFFDQKNGENYEQQIDLKNKIEDILPNLQMIYKYDAKITQNDEMEIKKLNNNQIEIICPYLCCCYSNIILDKNKKYVFRLQTNIHSFEDQTFTIGLIHDQYKELKTLEGDQFFRQQFKFSKENKYLICKDEDFSFTKVKDDQDKENEFMSVQVRVDQQNEILEIVDYPNCKQKFSLKNDKKRNMKNNDYRLHLFVYGKISVTLINAFICEQFDN